MRVAAGRLDAESKLALACESTQTSAKATNTQFANYLTWKSTPAVQAFAVPGSIRFAPEHGGLVFTTSVAGLNDPRFVIPGTTTPNTVLNTDALVVATVEEWRGGLRIQKHQAAITRDLSQDARRADKRRLAISDIDPSDPVNASARPRVAEEADWGAVTWILATSWIGAESVSDARHIIEYLLYVRQAAPSHRQHLSTLWNETMHVKWGPFFRLRKAARSFSCTFEDPFVLLLHDEAHSVDEPLESLKHLIRDSYRQALLLQASKRRQDCQGTTHPIHIELTRSHYFSLSQPLHQTLLRQILTGSIDHRSRLFKSNLANSPLCPFCNTVDGTAQHIFWDCTRWQIIRSDFPILLRLFHLVGSQWPSCFLHCGWFEQWRDYGLSLLDSLQLIYDHDSFIKDTHQMYLQILLCRYEATQVLQSTPITPPDIHLPLSIPSSPSLSPQLVQLQGEVSPISIRSSEPG